jgi:hypothetical protein
MQRYRGGTENAKFEFSVFFVCHLGEGFILFLCTLSAFLTASAVKNDYALV